MNTARRPRAAKSFSLLPGYALLLSALAPATFAARRTATPPT